MGEPSAPIFGPEERGETLGLGGGRTVAWHSPITIIKQQLKGRRLDQGGGQRNFVRRDHMSGKEMD